MHPSEDEMKAYMARPKIERSSQEEVAATEQERFAMPIDEDWIVEYFS